MIQDEFYERRHRLMNLMEPNSLAIIPSAPKSIRNRDIHYTYRQDSDFYYLTGFTEPEAMAVLTPNLETRYILFCREKDVNKECWEGPITGPGEAIKQYGADATFPIGKLDEIMLQLLEQVQHVYYAIGHHAELDLHMTTWLNHIRAKIRTGINTPRNFSILDHYLHELRLVKSANELSIMRTAATISSQAHIRVMRSCRPGKLEYELAAEFVHECSLQGAINQAYAPIIGGGSNACVLHYESNKGKLIDGDLVLVDAGCEYNYYAADITRTFPVNGRFSPPQQEIYDTVLAAQQAALTKIKPGNTLDDAQQAAAREITKGLLDLKILTGGRTSLARMLKKERYKPFYMHRIGHWLGIDVHDVGTHKVNGQWRTLTPGMCLTVEPGIYIGLNAPSSCQRWRGIGVRIEDDVVVTANSHEILNDVPKTIRDIEALMGRMEEREVLPHKQSA